MNRTLLFVTLALGALSTLSMAQPAPAASAAAAPPKPKPIEFRSVAQARSALEAEDGKTTIVTHPDEWVVVTEPAAAAQWSFTPPGYYAYPAVVRRIILRGPNRAVSVDTSSLCEAPAEACERLLKEFESMNERIVQSTKARGGQGSARP
ncbi:MAG: hypothetical protein ABIV63_09140 [Caldimonas sp.]